MGLPFNPVPKPSYARNKPTAKQRGQITTKVRRELRERSGGICERCEYNLAVHAAHLVRRWQIPEKTTVKLVAHLCLGCHTWADTTKGGREWLKAFKTKLEAKKNG